MEVKIEVFAKSIHDIPAHFQEFLEWLVNEGEKIPKEFRDTAIFYTEVEDDYDPVLHLLYFRPETPNETFARLEKERERPRRNLRSWRCWRA